MWRMSYNSCYITLLKNAVNITEICRVATTVGTGSQVPSIVVQSNANTPDKMIRKETEPWSVDGYFKRAITIKVPDRKSLLGNQHFLLN